MPQQPITRICPYLGLPNDPRSHFAEPDDAHHCYSPVKPGHVAFEHQKEFCFSSDYSKCKRYVQLADSTEKQTWRAPQAQRNFLPLSISLLIVAIGLLALVVYLTWMTFVVPPKITPVALATVTNTRPTPSATLAPTVTQTPTRTPPALRSFVPLVIPTPPGNGMILTLSPEVLRTGWVGSKETEPHWGEESLRIGTFQNQNFAGIIQFDLAGLPPASKILFTVLELAGRDASRLGENGEWRVEMVDPRQIANWSKLSYDEVIQLPALGSVGARIKSADLAAGAINRIEFDNAQRQMLESQLDNPSWTFRVTGPVSGEENLFAWDSGGKGSFSPPILYLVAIPGPYTVITNTPTPGNVLTAAAAAFTETALASARGTKTPMPRSFVTATPGAAAHFVVTNVPTPGNPGLAQATAMYATAIAVTTGTFTPVPSFWVTATPLPLVIPKTSITPIPSPTATMVPPTTYEIAQKPLPSWLYGRILFKEGPRLNPRIWVMEPNGTVAGLLTDPRIYDIAQARDTLSPDGKRNAYNAYWGSVIQIWSQSLEYPAALPDKLTFVGRGYTYAPAWSPDSKKIAYVAADQGIDEIYVWDWDARKSTRITYSNGKDWFWNQFPSYSPDGKQIVYSSDRGHSGAFTEIWVMNEDGSDPRYLGNGEWDAYAPVWIKWQQ